MRRITLWLLSTLAAVVLLFSYRTSTQGGTATAAAGPATTTGSGTTDSGTTDSGTTGNGTTDNGTTGSGTTGGGTTGSDGSTSSGSGAGTGGSTYNGSVASTRWGDIQVTITVAGGKITSVTVPVYPDANNKDRQINARALPILNRAAVAAQSADIDTVSGATVTSDGYKESLQAAIDAAHLS